MTDCSDCVAYGKKLARAEGEISRLNDLLNNKCEVLDLTQTAHAEDICKLVVAREEISALKRSLALETFKKGELAAELSRAQEHQARLDGVMLTTPASHAQAARDSFWRALESSWEIEPRRYFEEQAARQGWTSPEAMAVHYMWKRDTSVAPLLAALSEVAAGNLDDEDMTQFYERARRVANAALTKARGPA